MIDRMSPTFNFAEVEAPQKIAFINDQVPLTTNDADDIVGLVSVPQRLAVAFPPFTPARVHPSFMNTTAYALIVRMLTFVSPLPYSARNLICTSPRRTICTALL